MNSFYVYIYLDPRKSGKYIYENYCFLYEPFYIGKGKGKRFRNLNERNNYFKNRINNIKKYNLNPIVLKLKEDLDEDKSFILESKLIKSIGRKDLDKGPLINLTDGGEGPSGINHIGLNNPMFGKKHSNKTKNLMSKIIGNRYKGKNNPMYNIHRYGEKAPHFGRKHSEESKKKISTVKKEKFKNGELVSLKGEDFIFSKLTEYQVKIIYQISNSPILQQLKITQKEIAKVFGVCQQTISNIKNQKYWKHLKLNDKKVK